MLTEIIRRGGLLPGLEKIIGGDTGREAIVKARESRGRHPYHFLRLEPHAEDNELDRQHRHDVFFPGSVGFSGGDRVLCDLIPTAVGSRDGRAAFAPPAKMKAESPCSFFGFRATNVRKRRSVPTDGIDGAAEPAGEATPADVDEPLGATMSVSLGEWLAGCSLGEYRERIQAHGYTHLQFLLVSSHDSPIMISGPPGLRSSSRW